jgi:hypothetical protein
MAGAAYFGGLGAFLSFGCSDFGVMCEVKMELFELGCCCVDAIFR